MIEVLRHVERIARKPHQCSFCNGIIYAGEKYEYSVNKFDDIYEWKNHIACGRIASELREYIDPEEGITSDDFQEACHQFCKTFICPECPCCEVENDGDCMENNDYCLHKIDALLQTHELVKVAGKYRWAYGFKLIPREGEPHDSP